VNISQLKLRSEKFDDDYDDDDDVNNNNEGKEISLQVCTDVPKSVGTTSRYSACQKVYLRLVPLRLSRYT